ncbi:MAG: HDOD domain-containing protein [Planctomycetes bacterium]|nr:HDOD domain-containing protein [Planctomycetota bacterium]
MTSAGPYEAILADAELPSPAAIAVELVQLTRDPDAEVDDVVRLVAMDPAICARVLKAVNAAKFGLRQRVVAVDQAVTMLGMRTVARMAIETSVLERSRSGLAEFDYGSFWAESLARAVAAQILAGWTRQVPAAEAFTYGLLGGIGRLALVSVHPRQYRELLLTLGRYDANELGEAERAVFDVDVETLSARMLRTWGLPGYEDALLAESAGDGAVVSRDQLLLRTCRAAGLVARILVDTRVTRAQIAAAMHAMGALGVGAEVVAHLFPDIVATLHEAADVLLIPTHSANSLAEVYANAIDTA